MVTESNMLTTKDTWSVADREELRGIVRGVVRFDASMRHHTTFGIGGPADAWVEPADAQDLARVLDFCRLKGAGVFVIGQGTNLLVTDRGIRGVVLRLCQPWFRLVYAEGGLVTAGAGASNAKLLELLKESSLGGMEYICGIPGGVGGGIAMNAGAHEGCFAEFLDHIVVMDRQGRVRQREKKDLDFSYRSLRNLGDDIVVRAVFSLRPDSRDAIDARVAEFLLHRNAVQPKGSGPGCVFKNPNGQSAGKLIDSLGLKGRRVGGAWVSERHGNFILNDKSATSAQVLELIEAVRAEVLARSGIALETEVKIVGEM